MARTSSTISSRVLRTLASECAALAETGMVSLCTPAASAASAPRRLGTSAITVRPGSVMAWRTTSAASAICGSSFGGHEGGDLDLAHARGVQRVDPAQLVRRGHRGLDGLQAVARADFADQDIGG